MADAQVRESKRRGHENSFDFMLNFSSKPQILVDEQRRNQHGDNDVEMDHIFC